MMTECRIENSRVFLLFDEKLICIKGTQEDDELFVNYADLVNNLGSADEVEAAQKAIEAFNSANETKISIVDY